MRLVHRHALRQAVGGAGGGEDEGRYARRPGLGDQAQRSDDIGVVEGRRFLDRLPDLDQRGEMHDADRLVLPENSRQPRAVADIALLKRPPFDEFTVTVGEIVVDDGGEAVLGQRQAGMGADIARAPDDQHVSIRHRVPPIQPTDDTTAQMILFLTGRGDTLCETA